MISLLTMYKVLWASRFHVIQMTRGLLTVPVIQNQVLKVTEVDRLICFLFNLKKVMRKKVSNTTQISCQAIEYQNLEAIYGIVINLSDNYFGNHQLEHLSSFSMYFLRCGEETGHGILHIAHTYRTIFFLYLLATFFLTQPRM